MIVTRCQSVLGPLWYKQWYCADCIAAVYQSSNSLPAVRESEGRQQAHKTVHLKYMWDEVVTWQHHCINQFTGFPILLNMPSQVRIQSLYTYRWTSAIWFTFIQRSGGSLSDHACLYHSNNWLFMAT